MMKKNPYMKSPYEGYVKKKPVNGNVVDGNTLGGNVKSNYRTKAGYGQSGYYTKNDQRWIYQDQRSKTANSDLDDDAEINGNIGDNGNEDDKPRPYIKKYPRKFQKKFYNKRKFGFRRFKPKKKKGPAEPFPQCKINKIALEMLVEYDKTFMSLDLLKHSYIQKYNDILRSKEIPNLERTVFYVLRWRGRLDYVISKIYEPEPGLESDEVIHNLYRLAVYNIMYLKRTLEHAIALAHFALPEGYEMYRDSLEQFILRAFEKYHKISYPDPVNEIETLLSITYSHPLWLVQEWIRRYGVDDTRVLLGYNNTDKTHVIRVNRLKSGVERIRMYMEQARYNVYRSPYIKYGLVVAGKKRLTTKEPYVGGEFYMLEEPEQMMVEWMAPKLTDTVIDACTGNGLKAIALAGMMMNKGKVIAVQDQPHLVETFRERMALCGVTNTEVLFPEEVPDYLNAAQIANVDKVLLLAPSSETGNIIRRPDVKWMLTPEKIDELAQDQLRHLRFYSQFIKPGGELYYGVYSLNPQENEEVIQKFLADNSQFVLVSEVEEPWKSLADEKGFLRLIPQIHKLSGFFACRLRRIE